MGDMPTPHKKKTVRVSRRVALKAIGQEIGDLHLEMVRLGMYAKRLRLAILPDRSSKYDRDLAVVERRIVLIKSAITGLSEKAKEHLG